MVLLLVRIAKAKINIIIRGGAIIVAGTVKRNITGRPTPISCIINFPLKNV